jgi:acyl dehydratase
MREGAYVPPGPSSPLDATYRAPMALNPDAVGSTSDPVEATWGSRDALLYAVGIGAGHEELAFTTENTNGVDQLVFPTFPVVIGWGAGSAMGKVGSFDPTQLVHGKQAVTLHRPIPVSGTVTLIGQITGMFDKGKAAVVDSATTATLDGAPLYTTTSSVFIRGAGGWGGERGSSGPQNVPPDRSADHEVTYVTSRDQAFVYRLSGDRNPLHTDPGFAAMGGFDTPILHGLCTYGFTGRALLHTLCASDPSRFHHIEGRFASPVFPGESLTIRMWVTSDGEAVFTTSAGDGEAERLVIDQGLLRHS